MHLNGSPRTKMHQLKLSLKHKQGLGDANYHMPSSRDISKLVIHFECRTGQLTSVTVFEDQRRAGRLRVEHWAKGSGYGIPLLLVHIHASTSFLLHQAPNVVRKASNLVSQASNLAREVPTLNRLSLSIHAAASAIFFGERHEIPASRVLTQIIQESIICR